jgi:O-antigen ligase
MKLLDWWEQLLFFFLCVAIAFLGIGRVPIPLLGGMSAWSISRTVFFFWLIWKLSLWITGRQKPQEWRRIMPPLPLLFFFIFVTVSLLPDFREAGDYRYFLFAFFHYVMVIDLFSGGDRPKLLLRLLGVLPGLLVVRGIMTDPSVLSLTQMNRFGFPLAHPNIAGYVFSVGIPLAIAVLTNERGWLRGLGGFSLGAEFVGLILTYSRTAWAACVVSLLGLGVMDKGVRRVILILGLIGFVLLVTVGPLRSRLLSLLEVTKDADDLWRLQAMVHAVYLGLERPLLGHGYGRDHLRSGLRARYPDFANQGFIPHSHSVYSELLAGTGFLGLGAFVWFLGSTLVRLLQGARGEQLQQKKLLYLCFASSLVAVIIFGVGDVPFYNHDPRLLFFTLLALIHLHLISPTLRSLL